MAEMALIDFTGKRWALNPDPETTDVFIPSGGISGLTGAVERKTITAPGVRGQRFVREEILPMAGNITFVMPADVAPDFVDGWDAEIPCVFRIDFLEVELCRNGPIPDPVDDGKRGGLVEVNVPVVADQGCWFGAWATGTNNVTVTNIGDVFIYPKIVWNGAGGSVFMPSGASFTIPATTEPRTLLIDPEESYAITDAAGVVDYALMKIMGTTVLPEGVPKRKARTYQLPAGAVLHWRSGFLDYREVLKNADELGGA